MKTTFIIIGLFIISTVGYAQSRYDYIAVLHTSSSQKPFKQSFITKKQITLDIIENQFNKMGYHVKRLNQQRKIELWNTLFTNTTTNNKTFDTIWAFVKKNPMFFAEGHNKSRTDYSIIIDNETYKIEYKSQKSFFSALTKYLKDKDCDIAVVKDLMGYIGIWS
jgi:hypothetical protein